MEVELKPTGWKKSARRRAPSLELRTLAGSVQSQLRQVWGCDLRSLALYRVFLGLVLFYDMFDRFPFIFAWYTDAGILSRRLLLEQFWNADYVSIHVVNGSYLFIVVLFLVQMALALSLLVGFHSTLSIVGCWYMHISLQIRNPLVLHNGDVYIRAILFFSMFLPLGERFSVDAALRDRDKRRSSSTDSIYVSAGTIGYVVQMFIVYAASWYHKYIAAYPIWFEAGTATYYALNLDYYRRWLGDLLLAAPFPLLRIFNWSVLYWEIIGPCLFVMPVMTRYCRFIGVLGTVALHWGFGQGLLLETFYYTGMMASLGLLPPWFWDVLIPASVNRFDARRRQFIAPKTIVYDRVRAVRLGRALQVFGLFFNTQFVAQDGPVGKEEPSALEDGGEQVLLLTDHSSGKSYSGMLALYAACHASPILWPLGLLLRLSFVHNLTDWYLETLELRPVPSTPVVQRPKMRSLISRKLRAAHIRPSSIFKNSVAALFIVLVVLWNGGNLDLTGFPQSLRKLMLSTLLYQMWNMFCPPPTYTWFHVLEGRLANNQTVDLMADYGLLHMEGRPWQGYDVPRSKLTQVYPNNRWHKMFEGFTYGKPWNAAATLEFGRYVCRQFNAHRPAKERLVRHLLWLQTQQTKLDYTRGDLRRELMHDHMCG